MATSKQRLRDLPKIDALLNRDELRSAKVPRWAVREAARAEVESRRKAILDGTGDVVDVQSDVILAQAARLARPSLRSVINGTGVVLHTNLGRAPMSPEVMARVGELACRYSNLEYDVDKGRRGSRHGHVVSALRAITGAADACVVNNNAAAVMLMLAANASRKEVVVSRGELIEIGGSFRIPDVMALSGAVLVEVGTTNKTRAADYERAITPDTALLLKVHQANFEQVGFTEETPVSDLAEVGAAAGVATMMDLGSGALVEVGRLAELGLAGEPAVRETLAAGIDVVTFSGDKLLGGPQAGIIAGRADLVEACRKHPLMRALRPDKITIAALEATLSLYRDDRRDKVPAIAMLSRSGDELRGRAAGLAELATSAGFSAEVVACKSTVGGGAKPTAALPSWAVRLTHPSLSADQLDAGLRRAPTPVVGRIADDALHLDVRTILDDAELAAVATAIASLSGR